MANKSIPTPDELRQLLNYDPETGKLFWKERGPEWFPTPRAMNTWNSRYANNEAFVRINLSGYHVSTLLGVNHRAHRVIWSIYYGETPDRDVDHMNGIKVDNRICNLRLATRAENSRNCGKQANNTSGYKGVSWSNQNKKWIAQISKNKKTYWLGGYDTPEQAVDAYNKAALELHGEFARIN